MRVNVTKLLSFVAAFLLLFSTVSFAGSAQSTFPPTSGIEYAPGEVLVQFSNQSQVTSGATMNMLNSLLGQNQYTKKVYNHFPVMFIKSSTFSTHTLMDLLSQMSGVESVSRNYIRHISGAPDDHYYANGSLWAMNNTGQNGGLPDADIDAKEAWDLQTGSRSVVVAVVDTGIDYTHEDLSANMWDGSSYGAPHHGWDFAADNDGNDDNDPMPDLDHGTHVAGTIGASANNSIGVAGVSQQVSLMGLKVFRPNGKGYDSDILQAMDFIADKIDHGVNVVAVNASYGGGGYSDTMKNAIATLGSKGVVFCAAAGNNGSDNDNSPTYPASYDLDNIIAVAATDRNDTLASFSNYGAQTVDIAAPGVAITSSTPGNHYATWSGTSMATPHVVGAVALLAANTPSTTVSQRINTLLSTVDTIPSLNGKVATSGRLNINNALIADIDNRDDNATPAPGDPAPDTNNTTWTTGAYSNNEDRSQELAIDGANSLTVTISGETEHNYDFIYIYDENGTQVGRFSGSIDQTITVSGASITARLTSDYSVTKSGVTVSIAENNNASNPVPNPDTNSTTWTTGAYSNNEDRHQELTIDGASSLSVTISGETEHNYDFIYIYDENGAQIARLSGSINQTITVPGSHITARLTSDYSVTKSGVTVSIASRGDSATPAPNPDDTTWTTGAYNNNEDRSQAISIDGASSLTVTISGETERNYDFIYIYDENGAQVGRFSGAINQTITVPGSHITARLTSDNSVTKSGVTVSIAANDDTSASNPTPAPDPEPTNPNPDLAPGIDVTTWITGAYSNNEDRRKVFSLSGANSLAVTIIGETERNYDFIYIYDENGNQVGRFSGAINQTITVPGSHITARITSDYSVTKSGVTVSIAANDDTSASNPTPAPDPEPTNPNPDLAPGMDVSTWITGAYSNNEDRRKVFSLSGANSLAVTIIGETERNYDFIYIYDENGNQVGRFSGSINQTITVPGSHITARLTSDYSVTKSGVTVSIAQSR